MGLQELYDKVASFEAPLNTPLNCKNGCSRCCYVDLSVFEVEANSIRKWFHALSKEKKEELVAKWQGPRSEAMSFNGRPEKSCVFLKNESCTIYEVRPLICRTQGLAIKFKIEEELLDICPLNEEHLQKMSGKEILNLDLINLILARLEQLDSANRTRERVSLQSVKESLCLPDSD